MQSSLLPEVPADADRVPESYLLQIVRKPKQRSERKPIARFKLLTPLNQVCLLFPSSCPDLQATCRQLALSALVLQRAKMFLIMLQVTEADEALILGGEKVEQTRWVIPARSTQQLIVQFQAEDMGAFKENLVFEVCPLFHVICCAV